MLRKISILLAFISVLGLGLAVAIPSISFAKNPNPNNPQNPKKIVVKQQKVVVKKNVTVKYVVGKKYNGHYWYGYNRHRWHGVWYAYGVGPCWINIDGLWFWNVLACPD